MDDIEQILPILFPCQSGARSLVELYDMIMDDQADPSIYEEMDRIRSRISQQKSVDAVDYDASVVSSPSHVEVKTQTSTLEPRLTERAMGTGTIDSTTPAAVVRQTQPRSSMRHTTYTQKKATRHTVLPASTDVEHLVPVSHRTVIKVKDRPGSSGITRSRLVL